MSMATRKGCKRQTSSLKGSYGGVIPANPFWKETDGITEFQGLEISNERKVDGMKETAGARP
jgi:hypothetical protein